MTKPKAASGRSAKKSPKAGTARARSARQAPPRLVVGIGASAGGLEAFRAFFTNMPPDSGMAFVLVQHLAPAHRSILVELIGGITAMPVVEAKDGMAIAPDGVFVIPPDATLTITDGRLRVEKPAPPRESRRPIDSFMFSLAEDQGEQAVCVILSGSGSDGALGLTAIKEHGGITLAQAQYDETAMSGMPSSAAATGLVDHILAVEDMPAKLVEYQRHLGAVSERKDSDGTRRDAAEHLAEICTLVHKGVGHDFRQYKQSTLIRRIQRRMQLLQLDAVPDYIAILRRDAHEIERLFQDFLIGVTRFFRDPPAFAALERIVVPGIVNDRNAGEPVRVWVPGCATGEEVYSIAILLREAATKLARPPKFMIFATDVNEHALAVARRGRYRKSQLEGLSAERLERWFVDDGDHSRIGEQIREMCIFSLHSLLRDPPLSRLDLISCRNLLIYFDSAPQDRLMPMFHWALRPGGYLFLGPSESVTRQADFFTVLDKPHRLFQRRDDRVASLPGLTISGLPRGVPAAPGASSRQTHPEPAFDQVARRVMGKYSPAYLVVDSQHQVVRFAGQIGKYLEPSDGAASFSLFSLIQMTLRAPARTALRDAAQSQQRTVQENVPIEVDGSSQSVNLIVEPILQATGRATHYVLAFQDVGTGGRAGRGKRREPGAPLRLQQLENELRATKVRLQAAIDQSEWVNEELRSANEEYQSMNEELQSSNEELETSKEEMQSINEELSTVNNELGSKNADLGRLNADLSNFLESTEIAMLFLDREQRVRTFTTAMTGLLHLREADRGRPVTEIASRMSYQGMEDDLVEVLRSETVIEREVSILNNSATYILRLRPYRSPAMKVDGVVMTFVDITERKQREAERGRLAAIVDSSQDAIIGHSLDGIITSWNDAAVQMFGHTAAAAVGQSIAAIVPQPWAYHMPELVEKLRHGKPIAPFDVARTTEAGMPLSISISIAPVRTGDGTLIAASTIGRDVTERTMAEEHRTLLMAELDHRVKNTLAAVQSIARQSGAGARSLEEFREIFESRLLAMSRTHDLLTESAWKGAPLRQIVMRELQPYAGGRWRFTVAGPEVQLSPSQALALGLGIHELATNAAKHGAFSVPEGRVEVSWTVTAPRGEPELKLGWIEIGGPPVAAPSRRGFGTRLIEHGLASELDGDVRLEFDPAGVRCSMLIPLRRKDP